MKSSMSHTCGWFIIFSAALFYALPSQDSCPTGSCNGSGTVTDEESLLQVRRSVIETAERESTNASKAGRKGKWSPWRRPFSWQRTPAQKKNGMCLRKDELHSQHTIGQTYCNMCRMNGRLRARLYGDWSQMFWHPTMMKCARRDIWGDKLVPLSTNRRRSEHCFHPSLPCEERNTDALRLRSGWSIFRRRRRKQSAEELQVEKMKNAEQICSCLLQLLHCEGNACMKQELCGCPALCPQLKTDLGCRVSLVETNSSKEDKAESLTNRVQKGIQDMQTLEESLSSKRCRR